MNRRSRARQTNKIGYNEPANSTATVMLNTRSLTGSDSKRRACTPAAVHVHVDSVLATVKTAATTNTLYNGRDGGV